MTELRTGTETQTKTPSREQVGRVARGIIAATYQDKLGRSGKEPTTPGEHALRDFHELQSVRAEDFKSGKPNITGKSDITMREISGQDTAGKKYSHKDATVDSISGVTDNDELVCTFKDSTGKVIEDSSGQPLRIPVPRSSALDCLIETNEKAFKQVVAGDALQVVSAHSTAQRTGKLTEADLPSPDDFATLEKKYPDSKPAPASDTQPEQKAPERTPVQQVDDLITDQIAMLKDTLSDPAKLKQLTQEQKEKAQKLLGILEFANEAGGKLGIAFKVDALRVLQLEGADTQPYIDAVKDEVSYAERSLMTRVDTAIEEAKKKIDPEQVREWSKLAGEPGGLLKLIREDKQFQKLMAEADDLSQAIFGREVDVKGLKEMIKKANLPPELQKEADEAEEKGDKSGILMVLLKAAAGIVLAGPTLATVGTIKATESALGGQG